jgi:hypothetical protein
MIQRNWFDTLNQALDSELLTELWPIGTNIGYNETVRLHVDDLWGTRMISVYRNENGLYERPVHYMTTPKPRSWKNIY